MPGVPRHKVPNLPQCLLIALPGDHSVFLIGKGVKLIVIKPTITRGIVLVRIVAIFVVRGYLVLGVIGSVVVLGYEGSPKY